MATHHVQGGVYRERSIWLDECVLPGTNSNCSAMGSAVMREGTTHGTSCFDRLMQACETFAGRECAGVAHLQLQQRRRRPGLHTAQTATGVRGPHAHGQL